jgi:hypothetical protein
VSLVQDLLGIERVRVGGIGGWRRKRGSGLDESWRLDRLGLGPNVGIFAFLLLDLDGGEIPRIALALRAITNFLDCQLKIGDRVQDSLP